VAPKASETHCFPGFPDFRANVTFVPIQFFTVVVPHCSRGTVRIVGYALRKILGWVDEHGNPTREQLRLTYRELIEKAGVSRKAIAAALQEAVEHHFLRCVQAPQSDRNGQAAQSGIYELCWDQDGRYTDSPSEFRGFYYPEAAMLEVPDGLRTAPRPKAARKNIPNAFFEFLLPREPLSVIRVVSALLFYSIQWGPGGERKVPVSRSMTELSRLTRLSRQHVHQAVAEAWNRGYIVKVDPGCFDSDGGKESRPAIYGIHWALSASAGPVRPLDMQAETDRPVEKGEREPAEQSQEQHGEPMQKGERHRCEKVDGERSKMVNDIRVKRELKNDQTTASEVETAVPRTGAPPEPFAAAISGLDLLLKVGFDRATAGRLAPRSSVEVIQRQIQWLPHRTATRNRLGLLRRAIEEDWPKPSGADAAETDSELLSAARVFASHYYAAYHNFSGEARTEPFPKDVDVGAQFVSRLLAQENDLNKMPDWGRRFGCLMREAHRDDPKAKPNLSFALVLFGDKFLRKLQNEGTTRHTAALEKAKEAHQAAFADAYLSFLRLTEIKLQKAKPSVYEAFAKHRAKLKHLMTGGPLLVSAERLAGFESEESRLLALAEFFSKDPQVHVPSFWEWDARINPNRFGTATASGALQETRL
jgi:hypothetical protein